MKLLCILILFALVGHVLVTKLEDYIKEVRITNEHIKHAKEIMTFMLAVPEKIDCKLQVQLAESENSCTDGRNLIPDLNLPPNVTEEGSENSDVVKIKIHNIGDKLKYQKMMQSAIKAGTDPSRIQSLDLNFPPNVPEKGRIEAPTIKLENLVTLLEERRIHTKADLRNRIILSSALNSLGIARREMTLDAITSLIRQNDPLFQKLEMMCRLVGVFRSIKYPHSYISSAAPDGQYCITNDCKYNSEAHVYKFIDGVFWEVEPNLINPAPIKPFISELE